MIEYIEAVSIQKISKKPKKNKIEAKMLITALIFEVKKLNG